MNYAVRPMIPSDFDLIRGLCFKELGLGVAPCGTFENFRRFLKRNPGSNIVVCRGNEVAGDIIAGHDGLCGYVYHLFVSPGLQSHDVALHLVDAALAAMRDDGVLVCIARVVQLADMSLLPWVTMGWTKADDSEIYYRVLVSD